MILGFKRRFERFVLDGSKTHTIRAGNRWKVGDRCDCYVDPRQKSMRLLGRWPCVKVESITIASNTPYGHPKYGIWIDDNILSRDETEALAWRDGFRTGVNGSYFAEMMEFWKGRLPFEGQVIHWRRGENAPSPQIVRKKKKG